MADKYKKLLESTLEKGKSIEVIIHNDSTSANVRYEQDENGNIHIYVTDIQKGVKLKWLTSSNVIAVKRLKSLLRNVVLLLLTLKCRMLCRHLILRLLWIYALYVSKSITISSFRLIPN